MKSLADITALSLTGLNPAGEGVTKERQVAPNVGYSLGDQKLSGRALLSAASLGYDIVVRLKDARPMPVDEIRFWASLLARLVIDPVDVVTNPPSSGKVPACEHLATLLAGYVAWELKTPYRQCFINEHPRGHKGSRAGKLAEREENPFSYVGPGEGARVLVVEDVVFTRSTATRCFEAATAAGAQVGFVVLYRA